MKIPAISSIPLVCLNGFFDRTQHKIHPKKANKKSEANKKYNNKYDSKELNFD